MKFYDNLFEEHVLNKKNNSNILWNYLMFFDWYEKIYNKKIFFIYK